MKYYNIYIVFAFLLFPIMSYGQRDNSWMIGYNYFVTGGVPAGPMLMTFDNQVPTITIIQDTANINACNASISDTLGNFLFYTNGIDIRDKNNNILQNGDSLNYGDLWETWHGIGMPLRQGALILPFPEHYNEYIIIHNTLKDYVQGNYYPTEMMFSKVDISLNQGLGTVVQKNQILITQDIADVAIDACRHGNGRDWWLIFQEKFTNCYYRFLLTPDGFEDKGKMCIDGIVFDAVAQKKYSPDGTKFARLQDNRAYFMDFDRCNGIFSNVSSSYVSTQGYGGLSFSPNSRYFYLTNGDSLFQYDMTATDIHNSKFFIAKADGMLDPYSPGGITTAQLAPNGKIYFNAGSVLSVPVIQYPDSAGLSCHFEQHGLVLPHLNNTIPNFPNFRLGAAFGSGCDSLTVSHQVAVSSAQSKVYPNPAHNTLYIELSKQAQAATFLLYDMAGKEVLAHRFSAKNTQLKLGILPKGVYFYKLLFNNQQEYGKLLIE